MFGVVCAWVSCEYFIHFVLLKMILPHVLELEVHSFKILSDSKDKILTT